MHHFLLRLFQDRESSENLVEPDLRNGNIACRRPSVPQQARPVEMAKKESKPKTVRNRKGQKAKTGLSKPVKLPEKKKSKKPGSKQVTVREKVPLEPELPASQSFCGQAPALPLGTWTVASDCSGLCTEGLASNLTLPDVKVIHKYASELCPEKRTGSKLHITLFVFW